VSGTIAFLFVVSWIEGRNAVTKLFPKALFGRLFVTFCATVAHGGFFDPGDDE
jgi:hypothetical protein